MAKKKKPVVAVAEAVQEVDAGAAEAVAPYRKALPVRALSWVSEVGDQPPLRAICGAMILAGLAGGGPRLARAGGRALLAHSLATGAKNFVKHRVDRTRPRQVVESAGIADHKMKPGRNEAKAETSFPSGHSAGAIAVARGFAREFPEYQAPALAAAGLVALAQIPRCAHYPTDVGAGLAIGLAAEAATDAAWNAAAELVEERLEDADSR